MFDSKKIIASVTNPLFHDRRMQRICSTLAENGAEVTLVGVKRKGVPDPVRSNFKNVLLNCWFNSGFLFYAEYNFRLFFYLLFHSFDLVISVDLDSLLTGTIVSKLKGKKKIYDAHEYFTEVPELKKKPVVKWVWSLIAKYCIEEFNLTVSASLADLLWKKYKKEFQLIRNLPDLPINRIEKPKEISLSGTVNILYIGYLNEGRGLESAIQMMKYLPDRVNLFLIGEGDKKVELQELSQGMKLSSRVHFEGWKNPSELAQYLKEAHLGLNLLEDRSVSYYYSLANKTFDYMHYGIPGIHMDFPEYRLLQEKYNGFYLTKSLEAERLSNLILDIIKDNKTFQGKRVANLKSAQQFIWAEEKKKLLKFINDVFER